MVSGWTGTWIETLVSFDNKRFYSRIVQNERFSRVLPILQHSAMFRKSDVYKRQIMECRHGNFWIGLGIGSILGAVAYRLSRTAKARQLESDIYNACLLYTSPVRR